MRLRILLLALVISLILVAACIAPISTPEPEERRSMETTPAATDKAQTVTEEPAAPAEVSGTINEDATWSGRILITGKVTVSQGSHSPSSLGQLLSSNIGDRGITTQTVGYS